MGWGWGSGGPDYWECGDLRKGLHMMDIWTNACHGPTWGRPLGYAVISPSHGHTLRQRDGGYREPRSAGGMKTHLTGASCGLGGPLLAQLLSGLWRRSLLLVNGPSQPSFLNRLLRPRIPQPWRAGSNASDLTGDRGETLRVTVECSVQWMPREACFSLPLPWVLLAFLHEWQAVA